jgi:Domain of unknown function (DUF4294)
LVNFNLILFNLRDKSCILILLLLVCFSRVYAQSTEISITDSLIVGNDTLISSDSSFHVINKRLNNGTVVQAIIIDGDTSYVFNMHTFRVVALRPYGNRVKDKQFRRLKYHVKKVYPYAKLASEKLNKYNEELTKVKSKRKRRKLLRLKEKELKAEFSDVIKKMSVTSGKVLVKLIDRETGESTYDIIKEMRGGFKAFVYQGVGKLYGADLKARYDPKSNEDDEMIERIVQMLEIQGVDTSR